MLHHFSGNFAEVYDVEDACHNRSAFAVPFGESVIAPCYLRVNVDDMETALAEFRDRGCQLLKEPCAGEHRITALMKDTDDTVMIIYQHLK